jgi:transposase
MRHSSRSTSEFLFVGIDVAHKTLAVAIDGESVREFPNNGVGWEKLLAAIGKHKTKARVVLEATGSYHFDLACELAAAPFAEVMVVNPRAAKAFHQAQFRRAKTDAVDATSLLEMGRRMEFKPWKAPSDGTIELRQLSRYIDSLTKEGARLKNKIHAAEISRRGSSFVVADLKSRLTDLQTRMTQAEQQLSALLGADADHKRVAEALKTVPGIGTATAGRLISEFVVLDPEMTAKQISAYAGLDPRPQESGTSVRGARGISRYGNGRLRSLLYLPAISAARMDSPFKAFAERIAARSGKKMVAIVAVMRKLLVTAWAMFRSGEAWDAARSAPETTRAA